MALAYAPGMAVSDDLITYKEAGELLNIQVGGLRHAIMRGRLHPVKIPGIVSKYLHRSEVEAYRDKKPWAPPPGGISSAQIGASGAPIATISDLASYAQMILREGQQAASAVAGAAVESAMRPIGDALRPISEAIAESQRPAPTAADITKVDEMLASAKAQMGMMLLQFIEAMRPMVEAINAGRQVTREDIAPLLALMQSYLSDGLQKSPLGPGLADAIAHVPDLLKEQQPGALAPETAQQSEE